MAEETTIDLSGNSTVQVADHQHTYRMFVGLMKYGAAAIAIVLILLAYFLL